MSTKSLLLTTAVAISFIFTGSQAIAKKHQDMCCYDEKGGELKDAKNEDACKTAKGTWKKHEMKDHDKKEEPKNNDDKKKQNNH